MNVKKILADAYLMQWDFERRRYELPTSSEIYEIGLALDKIEPLFTIDRIQAFVDDKVKQSQAEEEVHEKQLKLLAQVYARTLFSVVLKYGNNLITIHKSTIPTAPTRGTIKGSKKSFRLRLGRSEIVTYNVYEYAIVKQRQTYASNTYPCYRPKQKGPATSSTVPTVPATPVTA